MNPRRLVCGDDFVTMSSSHRALEEAAHLTGYSKGCGAGPIPVAAVLHSSCTQVAALQFLRTYYAGCKQPKVKG